MRAGLERKEREIECSGLFRAGETNKSLLCCCVDKMHCVAAATTTHDRSRNEQKSQREIRESEVVKRIVLFSKPERKRGNAMQPRRGGGQISYL